MDKMDKQEYIADLDMKIIGLTKLMNDNENEGMDDEVRRLSGKIEGVRLARDIAKDWLREDI